MANAMTSRCWMSAVQPRRDCAKLARGCNRLRERVGLSFASRATSMDHDLRDHLGGALGLSLSRRDAGGRGHCRRRFGGRADVVPASVSRRRRAVDGLGRGLGDFFSGDGRDDRALRRWRCLVPPHFYGRRRSASFSCHLGQRHDGRLVGRRRWKRRRAGRRSRPRWKPR